MRSKIVFVLTFFAATALGQGKVCFTFDDLPVLNRSLDTDQSQAIITQKLLASLKREGIPATGFVNEIKLYSANKLNIEQVRLLEAWYLAGMDLGNHAYSHMDYNQSGIEAFFNDITRGETITKKLAGRFNKKLKYFRHPYLHSGHTKARSDSLRSFLKSRGYEEAPVTIDNSEWIYDLAYYHARNQKDTSLMRRIGSSYIDYMEQKSIYYQGQSVKLFGRDISHVLLLHANALNADQLDALIAMYRKNGFQFIPLDAALTDLAYKTPVTVFQKGGISWLDRWALSQGKQGDFFKDEPVTPEFIMKAAGIESE